MKKQFGKQFGFAVLLALLSGAAHAQGSGSDLRSGAIFSSGNKFEEKDGKALYENICQGCHMPDAKGATGAGTYPALAQNPRLGAAIYPAMMVTNGQRGMPGFGGELDDEQIAAVVNYVRTHFGNDYKDTLAASAVKALRK